MFRRIGQVVALLSLGWSAHAERMLQKPTPPPKPPTNIPSISMCAVHNESPLQSNFNDVVGTFRPAIQQGGQAFASRAIQGVCPTTTVAAGTNVGFPTGTDPSLGGWWAQCDRNPYLPVTINGIACGGAGPACPTTSAGQAAFCNNAAGATFPDVVIPPAPVNAICTAALGVKGNYLYQKIQTHGSSIEYGYSVTSTYKAVGGGQTAAGASPVSCTYYPTPTVTKTWLAGQTFRFLKCPIASLTQTITSATTTPAATQFNIAGSNPLASNRIAFWETVTVTFGQKGCYDVQWY